MSKFMITQIKNASRYNFMICVFVFAVISSCKNDPKETEIKVDETETNVSVSTPKAIKSASKEIKKIRLELQVQNESNVISKGVFSDQAGAVALLASVKGTPQTTYTGEIMEFRSGNNSDFKLSNLKPWNPSNNVDAGKITSVVTDENGRAAISHSTGNWCIECGDVSRNIKGKVFLISEQNGNASKIVAASIIE